VCRFMGVAPERCELAFVPDDHPAMRTAAGLYVAEELPKIFVRAGQLAEPVALVATFAHELAHDLLLPTGYLSVEESDHEYVTDLLTVFLGMGVFGANSHIRERYTRDVTFFTWSIGRTGYLSERMYGYALALFAWIRSERSPAWASHLRPNVRDILWKGLRYLGRTRDTQFRDSPDSDADLAEDVRLARYVSELDSTSSGARLASLRRLKEAGAGAAIAVPSLILRLNDSDRFVRYEAAELLGRLGSASESAVPALIETAFSESDAYLASQAALSLGQIGSRIEEVLPVLKSLLSTDVPGLEQSVVTALASLGPAAGPAVPALAQRLKRPETALAAAAARALGCIGPAASVAVGALVEALESGEQTVPVEAAKALGGFDDSHSEAALRKSLRSGDPEVRCAARESLIRRRQSPATGEGEIAAN
jgi:hypothetical protein